MEMTVEQLLRHSVDAHNSGDLQEAERGYQAILEHQPKNPNANHNLGLIAVSENQIEGALSLFKTAVDISPQTEEFWISYIKALVKNNQRKDAKHEVERAKKAGMAANKMEGLIVQPKAMEEMRILYKNCPLCESSNFHKSVVGDCSEQQLYNPIIPPEMQWMDCEDCQHQFINGHFTDEALAVIFSTTPEHTQVGHNLEAGRLMAARIIETVMPYKSDGPWLDVGFGNGVLLFTAKEFGYEPIGVDLRKDGVATLKAEGIQAHCDLVQNIEFEKPMSVVSMMDVLEHIPYPKEVLRHVHSIMDKNGCLLVSMPNSESWLWKVWSKQGKNPYFNTIEHFHNFSRTRLVSLLEECGFIFKKYGVSERYRSGMEVVARKA